MLKRKMFNGFFAFALVAALVMAGCGGGGGGGNGNGTPPEMAGPTDAEKIAAAQGAAKKSAETAKEVSDVAAAAVAEIEDDKNVDLTSYVLAREKARLAMAAYILAQTASDTAALATDAEVAAAQAKKAAAAAMEAVGFEDEALEYVATLTEKRNAAAEMSALEAAKVAAATALGEAQAALATVTETSGADSPAYTAAQEALEAAILAEQAAQDAETREAAETAQMDTETARADVVKYTEMVTALSAARFAATVAYTAAKDALAGIMDDRAADEGSYARAEDAVDDAEAANEMAQGADTPEEAEAAQADAETARDNAVRFAEMVASAKTVADDAATSAATSAAIKAATTAAAITKEKAIDEIDKERVADKLPVDYSVERDAMKMVTGIDVDGYFPAEGDPAFKKNKDGMFVRVDGDETEIVSVSTLGLDKAKKRSFRSVYGAFMNNPKDSGKAPNTFYIGTTSDFSARPGFDDEDDAAHPLLPEEMMLVAGRGFSSVGTVTYTSGTTVEGSFHGVDGTFECVTTDNCGATSDSKGEVTSLTGSWVFTLDSVQASVAIPDTDYLEYGFWLKKTEKDGKTTYNAVHTFAGQTGYDASFDEPASRTVEGTASYDGPSAGVYVHKTLGTNAGSASATSGSFTADVSLTANFLGPKVAQVDHNTVTGTVSNFDLSGGEANAWVVKLKGNFEDTDAGTQIAEIKGTTDGGGASGFFTGMFHGETVPGADPAEGLDEKQSTLPAAVTGTFDAKFVNGSAAGAFGATR